ncbi:MAG: DsbA family oxidoreductase [Pseudomonadota bacterium]
MRIDIFFDLICPWCFIGKRRLETALALRPGQAAELSWQPFQLNPDMPPGGMPRQAYLDAKFGGPEHAGQVYSMIRETAAKDGIALDIDRIRTTPNTLDGHRLVRLFQRRGADVASFVERMFEAYFQEGQDISDYYVLAAKAAECGEDSNEVLSFLESDDDRSAVLAIDHAARQMGIQGVPCFVVDRRFAVSGAQEPSAFLPVFDLATRPDQATA